MTELRQRMIRTMDLRNLSKNSKIAYLRAVTGLAKHYRKSPDTITEEMIEDYLLYLKNQKGRPPSGIHSDLTGLKFFYKHVLDKQIVIGFTITNKPQRLPTVLTQEQVWKIIRAPKNMKHRLILMTTYSAGLRAMEVARLKPEHIDSKRMLIKVVGGKGNKDRYTMLSTRLLVELRRYYKKHCPQSYLFPSSYKKEDKPLTRCFCLRKDTAKPFEKIDPVLIVFKYASSFYSTTNEWCNAPGTSILDGLGITFSYINQEIKKRINAWASLCDHLVKY